MSIYLLGIVKFLNLSKRHNFMLCSFIDKKALESNDNITGLPEGVFLDVIGTKEENPTENHTTPMVSEIYT